MTYHHPGASWFLAQFKPNSHQIALRNLTLQGFQTFCPLHEETRRARATFATQLRPLFPGYLFVAFNIFAGNWRAVNSTQGITRLVSFGKEPTAVPLDIVSQLMLRCDRDGRLLPPKRVQPGDRVTISSGPLADFVATVETIAPDRRVWVLLDLMGGQTRVAVPSDQIRAA